MLGGYRHDVHSGYAAGGNGGVSRACVRPPSAICQGARAIRCRSGQCAVQCLCHVARPDGHVRHRPCRRAVWPDVCVAGPSGLPLTGWLRAAGSASGNHVPEPPDMLATRGSPRGRRVDGACNRACRGRWDWGRYAVRRGGWHAGRVDTGAFPLNLVVLPQVVQHGFVDALPASCLLPCVQAPPATHAAAAAQFTGQIFRKRLPSDVLASCGI
ncbi:hypothetical protein VM94_04824 [Janthinobacterium sp. KBS0711]|nr:hypothetical protein VM94_04824 [Janthinobacterium sp. KBS0711]